MEDTNKHVTKSGGYTNKRNDEIILWMDSSKTKAGKAGYGIYCAKNSHLNTKACTVGDQTSDNTELQAMLKAVELSSMLLKVHIVTDNELVSTLMNKLVLNLQRRSICTKRSVEQRIHEELMKQNLKGYTTKCMHIYSHITKKKITRKGDIRWNKKLQKMEEWGDLFKTAVLVKGHPYLTQNHTRDSAMKRWTSESMEKANG